MVLVYNPKLHKCNSTEVNEYLDTKSRAKITRKREWASKKHTNNITNWCLSLWNINAIYETPKALPFHLVVLSPSQSLPVRKRTSIPKINEKSVKVSGDLKNTNTNKTKLVSTLISWGILSESACTLKYKGCNANTESELQDKEIQSRKRRWRYKH